MEDTQNSKQPASQPSTRLAKAPRALKIFAKDAHKYGATPGCRACTEVLLGKNEGKCVSSYIVPHNDDCRAKMAIAMREGPVDAHRVGKVEGRKSRHDGEKAAARDVAKDGGEDNGFASGQRGAGDAATHSSATPGVKI